MNLKRTKNTNTTVDNKIIPMRRPAIEQRSTTETGFVSETRFRERQSSTHRAQSAKTAEHALKRPHAFVPGAPLIQQDKSEQSSESQRERIEPDARTKRAASKKQAPLDALKAFLSNHRIFVITCIVLVGLVWAIYPPLKDFYAAKRDCAIREQVLAQIKAENEDHQAEIARLQTPEGIKDEARARGWVDPGEVTVIVEGLDSSVGHMEDSAQSNAQSASSKAYTQNVTQQKTKGSSPQNSKNPAGSAQGQKGASGCSSQNQSDAQGRSDASQSDDSGADKRAEIGKVYKVKSPWWTQILDKVFFYKPLVIKAH